jgi:hypothetical protein
MYAVQAAEPLQQAGCYEWRMTHLNIEHHTSHIRHLT